MRKLKIMHLLTLVLTSMLVFAAFLTIPKALSSNQSDVIESLEELSEKILELPDEAFKDPRSMKGHRGALLNKINAVINQIKSGANEGAVNKLVNDIEKTIWKWIEEEWAEDLIEDIEDIIEKIVEGDKKPPLIAEVWREPDKLQYEYNETVTVKARVTDESTGVDRAILFYWNGSAFENVTMEGEEPIYTGTIPPLLYDTKVEYWVNASDRAGNWVPESERKVYFYTVTDSYRPIARIEYPSPGSLLAGEVNITIYAFDDNFVTANLTIDGEHVTSWDSVGTHTYAWNTTSPQYPDGEYEIELTAYDIAGNNLTAGIPVTIDNTPPLAIINAPAEGSYVKGTVTVDVTGTDENFEEMKLSIDDTPVESWNISGSHFYSWDTANYPDGAHTITMAVYDKAGNINGTAVMVTVDNTLPTLSIDSPLSGDFLKGTVLVKVTGSDDNFEKMELYLDDALVETFSVGGTNTYSWDTLAYTDGVHTIGLRVYDKAGNSATDMIIATIDNTKPEIGIPIWEPEEPSADEQVNVTVSVSDAGGLRNVTLWYNVTGEWLFLEMTLANGNWTATIPGHGGDETVVFYVEAYDEAGNSAVTTMYEYTVKTYTGWPLAWLAGIALGVAALTGSGIYGFYRRKKKKSAGGTAKPENKPVVSFYVPAKILTRDKQTREGDK